MLSDLTKVWIFYANSMQKLFVILTKWLEQPLLFLSKLQGPVQYLDPDHYVRVMSGQIASELSHMELV